MPALILTTSALLMAFFFLVAGAQKLALRTEVTSNLARLGVGGAFSRSIGAAEILGAVGIAVGPWYPPLGVAAAAGLAALMLGAIGFHAQAGDYRRIGRHRDAVVPPILMVTLLVLCAALLT
jgi:uncharacterized membrane protein YphA (DoxX/SURF4 family)